MIKLLINILFFFCFCTSLLVASDLYLRKDEIESIHSILRTTANKAYENIISTTTDEEVIKNLNVCCGAIQWVRFNDEGNVVFDSPVSLVGQQTGKPIVSTNTSFYQILACQDNTLPFQLLSGLMTSSYSNYDNFIRGCKSTNFPKDYNLKEAIFEFLLHKLKLMDGSTLDSFFPGGMSDSIDRRKYEFQGSGNWLSSGDFKKRAEDEITKRKECKRFWESVCYSQVLDTLSEFLDGYNFLDGVHPQGYLEEVDIFSSNPDLMKHSEPLFIWWLDNNVRILKKRNENDIFPILHLYTTRQTCPSCENLLQQFANNNKIGVIISFSKEYSPSQIVLGGKMVAIGGGFKHPYSELKSESKFFPVSLRLASLVDTPLNLEDVKKLTEKVDYSKSLKLLSNFIVPLCSNIQKIVSQIFTINASFEALEARVGIPPREESAVEAAVAVRKPIILEVKKMLHSLMCELEEIDFRRVFEKVSKFSSEDFLEFSDMVSRFLAAEKLRRESWENATRVPFQFKLPPVLTGAGAAFFRK